MASCDAAASCLCCCSNAEINAHCGRRRDGGELWKGTKPKAVVAALSDTKDTAGTASESRGRWGRKANRNEGSRTKQTMWLQISSKPPTTSSVSPGLGIERAVHRQGKQGAGGER